MSSLSLTKEQSIALERITAFLNDDRTHVFILRGSAGTGKTTLIARLVDQMADMGISFALLAPTGRAARILGMKVRQQSKCKDVESITIHKAIYTYEDSEIEDGADSENDPGIRLIFPLKPEPTKLSAFVIDESSMVGDTEMKGDILRFGSGRILNDLITFSRLNRTTDGGKSFTKLIFVGDHAQLPPVGDTQSPALSSEHFNSAYKLNVDSFDLTTVMRQAEGSAILDRATEIRDAIFQERFNSFSLRSDRNDIQTISSTQAVESALGAIRNKESSVVVVRSNAQALEYNQRIREQLWSHSDAPVSVGDLLLICKNSHALGLNNGDLVKVVETDLVPELRSHVLKVKGKPDQTITLRFRAVKLAYREADGRTTTITCQILENLLDSPRRELTPMEHRALLVDFRKRHPELKSNSKEFKKALRDDECFNALLVKYGYAMTCHKAQGGEWDTVIVDFDASAVSRNSTFFRWTYTAITRASKKLLVVNPPQFDAYTTMDWGTAEPTNQAPPSPLEQIHTQLTEIWTRTGITVLSHQALQYAERYELAKGGDRMQIQYSYNKRFEITNLMRLPNTPENPELFELISSAFKKLDLPMETDEDIKDPFLMEFRTTLEDSLAGSGIRITSFKTQAFSVRVMFQKAEESTKMDFFYNKEKSWTKVTEVGKTSITGHIASQVRELTKAKLRAQ